jgi:hypothetical protein
MKASNNKISVARKIECNSWTHYATETSNITGLTAIDYFLTLRLGNILNPVMAGGKEFIEDFINEL